MRIVQLIDTLDSGGAERMAVNYANALLSEIEFSGLVTTRKEGSLKSEIKAGVGYHFINKRKTVDVQATLRLRKYIIKNKIDIIHAHGTSFFAAFLVKMLHQKVKIIWHDHYGDSEFLHQRPKLVLKIVAPFFLGTVVVNHALKTWSEKVLKCRNVIFLPNFPILENKNIDTILQGNEGKRIVCLANFRPQKDHFLLLQTAVKLKETHPEWSFHLVGKNFNDTYFDDMLNEISTNNLERNVFIYESKNDITNILNQSEIAILTSKSEGLPLALLEYGLCKMPVVVTSVGEIPKIICNEINGLIVPSSNPDLFVNALRLYIDNEVLSIKMASNLHEIIINKFSQKAVISMYASWLKDLKP